jgi:hypothetical protein
MYPDCTEMLSNERCSSRVLPSRWVVWAACRSSSSYGSIQGWARAGGCGRGVDGSGRVSAYSGESRNHLPNVALKLTRASKDAGLRHAAHSLTTSRGPARSYSSPCRMEVP